MTEGKFGEGFRRLLFHTSKSDFNRSPRPGRQTRQKVMKKQIDSRALMTTAKTEKGTIPPSTFV